MPPTDAISKTTTVSARIDEATKENAVRVFERLGLTTSQAIMLFYKQVELRQDLPFSVELPKTPNEDTLAAIKKAENPEALCSFETPEALFRDLGV